MARFALNPVRREGSSACNAQRVEYLVSRAASPGHIADSVHTQSLAWKINRRCSIMERSVSRGRYHDHHKCLPFRAGSPPALAVGY